MKLRSKFETVLWILLVLALIFYIVETRAIPTNSKISSSEQFSLEITDIKPVINDLSLTENQAPNSSTIRR